MEQRRIGTFTLVIDVREGSGGDGSPTLPERVGRGARAFADRLLQRKARHANGSPTRPVDGVRGLASSSSSRDDPGPTAGLRADRLARAVQGRFRTPRPSSAREGPSPPSPRPPEGSRASGRPMPPPPGRVLMRRGPTSPRPGDGPSADVTERLPRRVRRHLETYFGTDLPDVRLHRGPSSRAAARALGAEAFTVGRDIHLGANPEEAIGPDHLELLAHEVTHVLQDRGGVQARGLGAGRPVGDLEAAAERAERGILRDDPRARRLEVNRTRVRVEATGRSPTPRERDRLELLARRAAEEARRRLDGDSSLPRQAVIDRVGVTLRADLQRESPEQVVDRWADATARAIRRATRRNAASGVARGPLLKKRYAFGKQGDPSHLMGFSWEKEGKPGRSRYKNILRYYAPSPRPEGWERASLSERLAMVEDGSWDTLEKVDAPDWWTDRLHVEMGGQWELVREGGHDDLEEMIDEAAETEPGRDRELPSGGYHYHLTFPRPEGIDQARDVAGLVYYLNLSYQLRWFDRSSLPFMAGYQQPIGATAARHMPDILKEGAPDWPWRSVLKYSPAALRWGLYSDDQGRDVVGVEVRGEYSRDPRESGEKLKRVADAIALETPSLGSDLPGREILENEKPGPDQLERLHADDPDLEIYLRAMDLAVRTRWEQGDEDRRVWNPGKQVSSRSDLERLPGDVRSQMTKRSRGAGRYAVAVGVPPVEYWTMPLVAWESWPNVPEAAGARIRDAREEYVQTLGELRREWKEQVKATYWVSSDRKERWEEIEGAVRAGETRAFDLDELRLDPFEEGRAINRAVIQWARRSKVHRYFQLPEGG